MACTSSHSSEKRKEKTRTSTWDRMPSQPRSCDGSFLPFLMADAYLGASCGRVALLAREFPRGGEGHVATDLEVILVVRIHARDPPCRVVPVQHNHIALRCMPTQSIRSLIASNSPSVTSRWPFLPLGALQRRQIEATPLVLTRHEKFSCPAQSWVGKKPNSKSSALRRKRLCVRGWAYLTGVV